MDAKWPRVEQLHVHTDGRLLRIFFYVGGLASVGCHGEWGLSIAAQCAGRRGRSSGLTSRRGSFDVCN